MQGNRTRSWRIFLAIDLESRLADVRRISGEWIITTEPRSSDCALDAVLDSDFSRIEYVAPILSGHGDVSSVIDSERALAFVELAIKFAAAFWQS